MSDLECDLSCDPANPRRPLISGSEGVKFATEDSAEVGDQASVVVNTTGTRRYVQQAFHPSMFANRPRSSSLGSKPNTNTTSQVSGSISCATGIDPPHSGQSTEHSTTVSTEQLDIEEHPQWQRVPTSKKRKICEMSPSKDAGRSENRFSGLPLDPPDNIRAPVKPNKPPPIVLYGIEDVNELAKLIKSTISDNEFKLKIFNKNLLRLMVDSVDNYKRVIELIRKKGLIGHTFTRKDNKPYRIVIKNLHHSTPHEAIVEEIEKSGNKIRGEIINARLGPNKQPSFIFFVNLEPNVNNKYIKDIQYIFHQRVKIEDPRKSKSIVQCQRCQQYGHSKNNCMRPYRCVKCGEGHKTSDCLKKDRNTPAKCALCGSDHPANYKGCQVYKEILARKSKKSSPRIHSISNHPQPREVTAESHVKTPPITPNIDPEYSFANVTKGTRKTLNEPKSISSDVNHSQQTLTVEQILTKQSEKIDLLLHQISTLLNLLTTIIPKLNK